MKTPYQNKHLNHPTRIIEGPFGPHQAKLMCAQCNVFLQWLPNNYKEWINET